MDQSILVSGESGAGKTETVKICLNHIASVQRGQVIPGYTENTEHDPVVKRVVQSNPLLEAFGNAKTRKNDNSSRFGKYLQLQFQKSARSNSAAIKSSHCRLVGSKCDVYLLEKNRVTVHEAEERNFHIFYQLLAIPDSQKMQFWEGLQGAKNESFKYVGPTKTSVVEGVSDADRFQETLKALALVGVESDLLQTLMRAICIVLQLGNLGFKALRGDADKSAVATPEELVALSILMGVSQQELQLSFTERTFKINKETHKVPMNAASAKEVCDAFAKEVYQKTFYWLVNAVNKATSSELSDTQDYGVIGLLDIFGFESFPQNRFEQLCINYANEKLQQKFNEDIFKNVQSEYKAECISLKDIVFEDNTDVLDLIEGRTGLINLLNQECIIPKGNDFEFAQKVRRINKCSKSLIVHRTDRMSFGIRHYAGQVMYDVEGFVSRNIDTLTTDLRNCAENCTNVIINAPRTELELGTKKKIGARWGHEQSNIVAPTVWTKYKSQLSTLMTNLRKTQSRYVRCIKPNSKKEPHLMEHEATVDQLRCAGVVAGITIARSSFPNRLPNSIVLARFSHLSECSTKHTSGMDMTEKRQKVCNLLLEYALKSMDNVDSKGQIVKAFAVGKTKTYFRTGALELLESCRQSGLDGPASTIQRAARGWLARNAGKHRKQLQQMEDQRERARLAEMERQIQLTREKMERHTARKKGLQELKDQVALLEQACAKASRKHERKIQRLRDQNEASWKELLAMQLRYSEVEEMGVVQCQASLVQQQYLIDESYKIITYLRKENMRARKQNAKVATKIETTKALIHANQDLKQSIAVQTEVELGQRRASALVKASLTETVSECKVLDERVAAQQTVYMGQAKARLKLQKTMNRILSMVQGRIRDRSIVEESVVVALQAEASSKSMMAALDVMSLQPDLTGSDVSLSSSFASMMSDFT